MTSRSSAIRFPVQVRNTASLGDATHKELQHAEQFLEVLLPKTERDNERKLCREIVRTYRAAARRLLRKAWSDEVGQDIAEYAVMLAVILVIVVGTLRIIGTNANTVFSNVASSIQ